MDTQKLVRSYLDRVMETSAGAMVMVRTQKPTRKATKVTTGWDIIKLFFFFGWGSG